MGDKRKHKYRPEHRVHRPDLWTSIISSSESTVTTTTQIVHRNSSKRLSPKLIAQQTSTMKPFVVLITAIAAMAAAHGHLVVDPGLNGRRQLRDRAPALVAR